MEFKHACFMSYRHGHFALMKAMADQVEEALNNELGLLISGNSGVLVWRDRNDLKPGDQLDPGVADALYHSVCMILLYSPTYFDVKNAYCAREFIAMKMLEEQRLTLLTEEKRLHGLIIPIILRGKDFLPAELGNQRIYCDISDFSLCERKISRNRKYDPEIKKIANYIHNRWLTLKDIESSISESNSFKLPEENQIMDWLNHIVPGRQSLPFTGGGTI